MSKLLTKETLERGRVRQDGINVQVKDVIKAMMGSEPCLFHNSSDNLMPVSENVYVGALPSDQAIALKIADIANRAKPPVICVALVSSAPANLMPVKHRDKLGILICDAHINNLTSYDDEDEYE